MDADVLVIGAGPAGSVAAKMLNGLGHKVIVLQGVLEADGDCQLTLLQAIIREQPRLAELLRDSMFDTPINRIDGYSANVKTLYGDGFALLGNAGEFLDPIFSSGITIALKSVALAVPLVDRQLLGQPVDWHSEYQQPLRRDIEVFRAIDAWYDSRFPRIIFQPNQLASVKTMICSILAGFAWDESNPMTQRPGKKIEAIVDSCPLL